MSLAYQRARSRGRMTIGGKVRPAVVLLDDRDDDFVAAPITPQPGRTKFDLSVHKWREVGFNVASTIRVYKLTVSPKNEVVRRLGVLAGDDRTELAGILRRAFSLDQ